MTATTPSPTPGRNAELQRFRALAERLWDAVVIGAGPAGSLAARLLASRGRSVLLVDKADFPRFKVCGCCINTAALHELELAGLGDLPRRAGAVPLHTLRLLHRARHADLPLRGGAALSRGLLDAELARQTEAAGAIVTFGTAATLEPPRPQSRTVKLRRGDLEVNVTAKVVVVAHGLAGRSLGGEPTFSRTAAAWSRIGIGTVVPDAPADYNPGTIFMICGRGAYVGLVRLEDGRLNLASAVDSRFLRASGGPAAAIAATIRAARLPEIPSLADADWQGTPWLTSSCAAIAGQRVFLIGDAAGYVEPFTGEGMAWAMASARAVSGPACEAIDAWSPQIARRWTKIHHAMFSHRHRRCGRIAHVLRHDRLITAIAPVIVRWPQLLAPLVLHTGDLID